MIYIYIFAMSSIAVDTEPPTDDDILSLNNNLLQVIRVNGDQCDQLGPEGEWVEASRCEVITACGFQFHECV